MTILVNGCINCPELLSCFNFYALRTRSTTTFYIPFYKTNYVPASPVIIEL